MNRDDDASAARRRPAAGGRWMPAQAALIGCFSFAVAVFQSGAQRRPGLDLYDLDGWGWLIPSLKAPGSGWLDLFQAPSLWKGPVVPFVFGLFYRIGGSEQAVLFGNALCYAAAAAVLFAGFCRLGAPASLAAAATAGWSLYLPNANVFAYFFAEPVIALVGGMTLVALGESLARRSRAGLSASGTLAGLLLLSRPPFILVVAALTALTWARLGRGRLVGVICLLLGMATTYLPWPISNAIRLHAFIPFTVEGGKILFQGVYLAGDDIDDFNALRAMPEFAALEAREAHLAPVEQYRYWQKLAGEQVRSDPVGQLRLGARKAVRFWAYLPQFGWRPAWKTAAVALLVLPLAAYGAWKGRRSLLIQLCTTWVGGLWAFHCIAHSQLRYNFPVLPMAFLLAGSGALALARGGSSPIVDPRMLDVPASETVASLVP